jgi:hypothetical protein
MKGSARALRLALAAALWGCGPSRPVFETGRFIEGTVRLTGATLDPGYQGIPADRGYSVWLPAGYDPTVAHRTVFVAPADPLFPLQGDPEAIYVGLEPPFDDTGPRSPAWEYFALVAAKVEQTFSVDRDDELVAGTGAGGAWARMLGCHFSKADAARRFGPALALRAQFLVAGRLPEDLPACAGGVATLWLLDTSDGNPPTDSVASLARVLADDRCAGTAAEEWPISLPEGIACDRYTGCPAGSPVVFCSTTWRGRPSDYAGVTGPLFAGFLGALDAAR